MAQRWAAIDSRSSAELSLCEESRELRRTEEPQRGGVVRRGQMELSWVANTHRAQTECHGCPVVYVLLHCRPFFGVPLMWDLPCQFGGVLGHSRFKAVIFPTWEEACVSWVVPLHEAASSAGEKLPGHRVNRVWERNIRNYFHWLHGKYCVFQFSLYFFDFYHSSSALGTPLSSECL